MNLIIVIKRKEHALWHPYRTCARARVMGEVEEVLEQQCEDVYERGPFASTFQDSCFCLQTFSQSPKVKHLNGWS